MSLPHYSQKQTLKLNPDLIDEKYENFLKSLNYTREDRSKPLKPSTRITDLSRPKLQKTEDEEDWVGPGRYYPKDKFLSTKSRTISVKIGKSLRFQHSKIGGLDRVPISYCRVNFRSSLNFSGSLTPSYSFSRTGHNLKLGESDGGPGVGRYSPESGRKKKAYTFKRSEREFNWKSNVKKMYQVAEFEKRFWK